MKLSGNPKRFLPIIFVVLFAFIVVGLVYFGSIPVRYTLTPGTVSTVDIAAPRSVKDTNETKARAVKSMNAVIPVYVRSEDISAKDISNLTELFSICTGLRNDYINPDGTVKELYTDVSNKLIEAAKSNFGVDLTVEESFQLITADPVSYTHLRAHET